MHNSSSFDVWLGKIGQPVMAHRFPVMPSFTIKKTNKNVSCLKRDCKHQVLTLQTVFCRSRASFCKYVTSMFRNQIGWNPLQMKGRFLSNGCNSPFCDLKILTLLLLLFAMDLSTTWTEKGVFSWYAESHSGMDKINVAKGRLKESGHGYEVKICTCHKMMPWKPLIYI